MGCSKTEKNKSGKGGRAAQMNVLWKKQVCRKWARVNPASQGVFKKTTYKKSRRGHQKFDWNFSFTMDFSKLLENIYTVSSKQPRIRGCFSKTLPRCSKTAPRRSKTVPRRLFGSKTASRRAIWRWGVPGRWPKTLCDRRASPSIVVPDRFWR